MATPSPSLPLTTNNPSIQLITGNQSQNHTSRVPSRSNRREINIPTSSFKQSSHHPSSSFERERHLLTPTLVSAICSYPSRHLYHPSTAATRRTRMTRTRTTAPMILAQNYSLRLPLPYWTSTDSCYCCYFSCCCYVSLLHRALHITAAESESFRNWLSCFFSPYDFTLRGALAQLVSPVEVWLFALRLNETADLRLLYEAIYLFSLHDYTKAPVQYFSTAEYLVWNFPVHTNFLPTASLSRYATWFRTGGSVWEVNLH